MKRFFALMLAALFLLTACQDTVDTTSDQSDVSTEEDSVEKHTLISVGKPYTLSKTPTKEYPDKFDQQLTDGQKVSNEGAHYIDARMVGFNENCNINIDLGDDGKRINVLVARALDMSIDGVSLPTTATFRASKDGKTFKNLGNIRFIPTGDNTVSEARLELKEATDYRYIKVYINKNDAKPIYFLDEVEVYADVPEKEIVDTVAAAYKDENIDRNAWKELSTGTDASPLSYENIALSCKYSFENVSFDERAPKNDTFLTDGERTNRYFGEDVWVGIKADTKKTPSIKLDLSKKRNDVYMVKVHALGCGIDVGLPDYIDVYGSAGAKDFDFLGRMYAPLSGNNYAYTLLLPEYINVKTLRFEFAKGTSNYWIEEIEVYAGSNQDRTNMLYSTLDMPYVTEDVLWDSSDSDYKTHQNLLLGRPQQISASYYANKNYANAQAETGDDTKILTDGKRCQNGTLYCYSGEYFYARNGGSIDFFYDLEKLSSIDTVKVNFLEQTDWGISRPSYIDVFLSENGEDWYKVYSYERKDDEVLNKTATAMTVGGELDKTYTARFVRFRVESAVLFIDELEAFGKKDIKGATRLADSGIKSVKFYTNPERAEYADVDNTNINAKDIAIIYPNGTQADSLLPMVAYLDEEGNVKDTFMDGFLIGPYGPMPSGAMGHQNTNKADWEYVYNMYFDGQSGLDVLDATVADVKSKLGITDYKVKIYFTMLTVLDTMTDFGDVDGDGVSEDLSTPAGRKTVVEWFTAMCINEFERRGYENLEIDGFYWVNEAIIWEHDDAYVIAEVSEYVHATGYNFLWVPYYTAHRYYLGYELGFDAVSMQPNAVFTTDAPLWRIPSAAELTKMYNMCVEIEHSYQCLGDPEFARTYMLYLYYGALTGYMDSIHVYYHDLENFAKLAYSDSELCRMQYDATYHFAKRDLDVTPDKKDAFKLTASVDTIVNGNLNSDNALSRYTLASSPEHGSVVLTTDGSFRYLPAKGYKGTDTFTYTYNNYLGESEECVVEITVG